jgi:DNA-binding transcriptional LysR family regulator
MIRMHYRHAMPRTTFPERAFNPLTGARRESIAPMSDCFIDAANPDGETHVMDTIETLRTFVRVVETGSLSAVAREMNASQSTISRHINQLEEHFGVRLLHRTTRHLSLTDDGAGLNDHAKRILELVDGMETALGPHKSSPVGHVRLGTPVSLGMMLMTRVPVLLARYPGLTVELVMQDRLGDMIEERLDLAVTIGEVAGLSLIKRGLGTVRRIAVAAPDYIRRRGRPRQPGDLADHDCIVRRMTLGEDEWTLTGPAGAVSVVVRGVVSTNNHEAVRGAALSGLGIALLPEYLVVDDIRHGRLESVLPAYSAETLPAHVVYPSRHHLAPRTRAVIDFLIEEVQGLRAGVARPVPPARLDAASPRGNVVAIAA